MSTELDIKYYAAMSPIDFFKLSMDRNELLIKLSSQEDYIEKEKGVLVKKANELDELEKRIDDIIYKNEQEHPHTIRYFAIPDFDYAMFRVGVVAKISNNGTTYVFAHDKGIIEAFNQDDSDIYSL